jgi:hypothetical protein
MDFMTQVLATVEKGRLQKAVEGLVSGAYQITPTRQTDTEVRGLVRNGDGREYGVTLLEGAATCSCPDALYRGVTCKHATVLALHVIRNPQVGERPTEGQAPDLRLAKVRRGAVLA